MKNIDFEDIGNEEKKEIQTKLQRINQHISSIGWKSFLGKFDSLEHTSKIIKERFCQCSNCTAKQCFKCSKIIPKNEASKIYGEFDDYPPRYEYFCDDCTFWAVSIADRTDNVPF